MYKLAVTSKSLDANATRLLLLCSLADTAKNFYELIDGERLELEEILEKLKIRFERDFRAGILEELKVMEQLPDESLAGFVERHVTRARRCDIPEKLQIDWITDHLPGQIMTIFATFNIAKVQLSVPAILDMLHSDVVKKLEQSCRSNVTLVRKKKKATRKIPRLWCDTHKICNHTTEQCFGTTKCSKSNSRFQTVLNTVTVSSIKRFTATVQFPSGEQLDGLIDTGADVSCIRASVAHRLGLQLGRSESIKTADGDVTPGYWTDKACMRICGIQLDAQLLAFNNLSCQLIIGLDLFRKLLHHVDLDQIFNLGCPPPVVNSVVQDYSLVMRDDLEGVSPSKLPAFSINTGTHALIMHPRR